VEQRTDILTNLVAHGSDTDPARCAQLATDLGLLASDLLVVAGHPVPPELLPPERDARIMKEFAYRATYCDHAQMAALVDFIRSLPAAEPDLSPHPAAARKVFAHPDAGHFATVLAGLIRNRGFGPRELPFMGLSQSTIYSSMVTHDRRSEHRWFQLSAVAGPLGWRFEDLIAIADEPSSERPRYTVHCHHLGRVYMEAIRLTAGQLIEVAKQADRLSERPNQGAWRPVSAGFAKECPDLTDLT
jgi:hypothetical protein